MVEDFTVALMHEKIKTQNLKVISPEKLAELNKYQIDRLKKALHFDMCKKFAVLGMELLRNQATTVLKKYLLEPSRMMNILLLYINPS